MAMMVDTEAHQVFDSLVKIVVGDGSKTLFWRDRWIHWLGVVDIAPLIHMCVDVRTRNRCSVQQALHESRWTIDVEGELNFTVHIKVMNLCLPIAPIQRDENSQDIFSWPADASGKYTARSVYMRLCQGWERAPFAACIWRSWAPLKCKIHAWLAVQHQIWTSDRRSRHGLQDQPSPCYTCLREEDNAEHVHIQCVYARQVWHRCFEGLRLNALRPQEHDNTLEWWLQARRIFAGAERRGFDTLVILVA